jgi:hypothetical protein
MIYRGKTVSLHAIALRPVTADLRGLPLLRLYAVARPPVAVVSKSC